MCYHDRNLHDGAEPERFTPPSMLDMPFARLADRRAAQEDAYIAWSDARAARRARMNQDALDEIMVGRAIAAQPHAFPGHCPSLSPAGDEAATPIPQAGVAASMGRIG